MYIANDNSKYWVETQTRRIIQFEIGNATKNVDASKENANDLKGIAEQIAISNSPKFSQLYNELVLSEKLEGNLHSFRWEYPKITISDVGSPFLQVIVSRDGKVVGYANTLDFVGQ
jgi:DNA-binding transcriptional regulator WhiA